MRGLTKALVGGCCLVLAASWPHAGGAEKAPSIRLPPDWFATSIEQRMRPGVLKGPVVEAWRTTCADRGREMTHFMVRDPYVYLIRQTEIACLYAATGETFWSWKLPPDEKPGPAWCIPLGPYLLVQTLRRDEWQASADERLLGSTSPRKPSSLYRVYRLLSAQTSEPVLELGTEEVRFDRPLPRPAVPVGPATAPGDRLTALAKELTDPSDPKTAFVGDSGARAWEWLHLCHGTAPDRAPLGNDPTAWKLADTQALAEFLSLRCVPVHGVAARSICGTADAWFTVRGIGEMRLVRVDPANGTRTWETPVLMDSRFDASLVVQSPFVALFQQSNAVIAYDIATGRPAWRYEWPFHDGYSHGFAALDDGLLILTDPVREHPAKTLRDPKTGKALGSGAELRLGLIKVEMQGRAVFQQELDIQIPWIFTSPWSGSCTTGAPSRRSWGWPKTRTCRRSSAWT